MEVALNAVSLGEAAAERGQRRGSTEDEPGPLHLTEAGTRERPQGGQARRGAGSSAWNTV